MTPKNTFTFQVGTLSCTVINDGVNHATLDRLFGHVPEAARIAALTAAGYDPTAIALNYNILLVQTGAHTVLVDTGVGVASTPGAGQLRESLRGLGITPDAIDVIVITHAHGDHIGGLTFMEDALAFPNARYVMAREEWEFWASDDALAAMPADRREFFTKTLLHIAPHVELFTGTREIVPGITAIPTPGHTIGHLALLIESGGETLLHIADAVHHPIQLVHAEWSPVFDWDGELASKTRRDLFAQAVRANARVTTYHFPFPGLGHVTPQGNAFRWQPSSAE